MIALGSVASLRNDERRPLPLMSIG